MCGRGVCVSVCVWMCRGDASRSCKEWHGLTVEILQLCYFRNPGNLGTVCVQVVFILTCEEDCNLKEGSEGGNEGKQNNYQNCQAEECSVTSVQVWSVSCSMESAEANSLFLKLSSLSTLYTYLSNREPHEVILLFCSKVNRMNLSVFQNQTLQPESLASKYCHRCIFFSTVCKWWQNPV